MAVPNPFLVMREEKGAPLSSEAEGFLVIPRIRKVGLRRSPWELQSLSLFVAGRRFERDRLGRPMARARWISFFMRCLGNRGSYGFENGVRCRGLNTPHTEDESTVQFSETILPKITDPG